MRLMTRRCQAIWVTRRHDARGGAGDGLRPLDGQRAPPRLAWRAGPPDLPALPFTFARVESTRRPPRMSTPSSAHLRSRGEHTESYSRSLVRSGSPPLARRARPDLIRAAEAARITSARAESTELARGGPPRHAAHLRLRGERRSAVWSCFMSRGLPSLARRARPRAPVPGVRRRLTSAPAESTGRGTQPYGAAAAHLRSRGEHDQPVSASYRVSGSPPLARRAPGLPGPDGFDVRLTSARAESTTVKQSAPSATPAHLRSRGEHSPSARAAVRSAGSPPLARRAPRLADEDLPVPRLTSARAESTVEPTMASGWRTAHLRSRGEHSVPKTFATSTIGSPPLARRAHLDVCGTQYKFRFTSARAEISWGHSA